jgi:hypothetical protein
MRKIEQLGISVPAARRRSIAVPMATCGVLVGTMVFGAVSSTQTTADTSANTASACSGGHLVAADPGGGYWIVNGVGAITTHRGAAVISGGDFPASLAACIVDLG